MRINAHNIRRLVSIRNKEAFFVLILLLQLTTVSANNGNGHGVPGGGWKNYSKVKIQKEELVKITLVDDIHLGSHGSLTSDQVGSDEVCIFSSTGSYSVTMTSTNGAFTLQSPNTTTDMPYSIQWTTISTSPVIYNTRTSIHTADRHTTNCNGNGNGNGGPNGNGNGSTNAKYEVTVASQDFNAAEPGLYGDVLTILIRPE